MGLFGEGVDIAQGMFKAICQNEDCRVPLGAIHIPCTSGLVLFVCHKCSFVSGFEVTPTGFNRRVMGKLTKIR